MISSRENQAYVLLDWANHELIKILLPYTAPAETKVSGRCLLSFNPLFMGMSIAVWVAVILLIIGVVTVIGSFNLKKLNE